MANDSVLQETDNPATTKSISAPPTNLIQTKLSPPRLPQHPVAFARHSGRLDDILVHSVCLVRAPSGYGKSTLCTLWFHAFLERDISTGWVSFERDDDDSARAIRYIFEATRNAGIEQDLVYDALTPLQSQAAQFVNLIFAFGKQLVLFFDDLDKLTDPRILQFLNYVLLHCPDNLHIVATCQANPALPIGFLDAHAQLIRITMEDLRLRQSEARELLADTSGLTDEDAKKLNDAMGGWVTGLRIGSAALRNNRDALSDIGLVGHGGQWLSEYLEENIFQHLKPDIRNFLTRCSVVETITVELCEALCGETGAAQILTWLADQNLFVQRLDDLDARFRIHPIFREFLQARLAEEAPGSIRALHRLASDWYARSGSLSEAISHAFDANESERAAELINTAAMSMVEHSDIIELLGWIARLPDEVIEDYFPLRLAQAWALTLTLKPQARALMDRLAEHVESLEDRVEAERVRRELAGIETIFLAVYEDRLDAACALGYDFLSKKDDEASFVMRVVRNAIAYCETQRGNTHVVHDLVRPAELEDRRSEQIFPTAYRYAILGINYILQGEFLEAERLLQSGLGIVEAKTGPQSASMAVIAAFAARCRYECGDLDGAADLLNNRLPIIDEAVFQEAVIAAYVVMIRIAALRGNMDEASALVERAELIGHEREWIRLLACCALERTRLRLPLTTDLDRLVDSTPESVSGTDLLSRDIRTLAYVKKTRCLQALHIGDYEAVDAATDWLSSYAREANDEPLAVKVKLARIASQAIRNPHYALDTDTVTQLCQLLGKGYGRTLLDGFALVPDQRLRSLLDPIEELRSLLDENVMLTARTNAVAGVHTDTVFSVLTSREIDVLNGVARGDSNKEIARRLHLTPETVKWHLKNTMRKLKADSRTQAVANASALGLSLSAD